MKTKNIAGALSVALLAGMLMATPANATGEFEDDAGVPRVSEDVDESEALLDWDPSENDDEDFAFTELPDPAPESQPALPVRTPLGPDEFEVIYQTGDSLSSVKEQITEQVGKEAADTFLKGAHDKEVAGEDTGVPLIESYGKPAQIAAGASAGVTKIRIFGNAARDKRTWIMKSKLEHARCILGLFGCKVVDRRTTTITIDPGGTGTRIAFKQLRSPNAGIIGEPTYTISAYRNKTKRASKSYSVGKNAFSKNLTHASMRGAGFIYTVTGSYKVNGKTRYIPAGRTGSGGCDSARYLTCKFY